MEDIPYINRGEDRSELTEDVLSAIMSVDEYSRIEHPIPYIFNLASGGKRIYYFGAPHVRDPQNPIFAQIEEAFRQVDPDMVFVEGIRVPKDKEVLNDRVKSATRDEVIHSAGESGFSLKLGVDRDIDWHSPEPTDEMLYDFLLAQGFSKEEVFAWELFHILPQYHRQMKRKGFVKYVEPYLYRFKYATNWTDFDYSYTHAKEYGENIFGESIDVENDSRAPDRIDPIPWEEKRAKQTVFNRISAVSTNFWDRKIVNDLAESMKTHKKIFVVYGASHAVMQEHALRKLCSRI